MALFFRRDLEAGFEYFRKHLTGARSYRRETGGEPVSQLWHRMPVDEKDHWQRKAMTRQKLRREILVLWKLDRKPLLDPTENRYMACLQFILPF